MKSITDTYIKNLKNYITDYLEGKEPSQGKLRESDRYFIDTFLSERDKWGSLNGAFSDEVKNDTDVIVYDTMFLLGICNATLLIVADEDYEEAYIPNGYKAILNRRDMIEEYFYIFRGVKIIDREKGTVTRNTSSDYTGIHLTGFILGYMLHDTEIKPIDEEE